MSDFQPIVNRVSQSGLITLDLSKYLPTAEICEFDIKPFLFKELLLKEKDFRQAMKDHDWKQYQNKNLTIHCSSDAIIPHWAYMLIVSLAEAHASFICSGTKEQAHAILLSRNLNKIDVEEFKDKRVIIKGCGDPKVGAAAYSEICRLLKPQVKSLMYGEACSTVPIFKRKDK